MSTTALTIDAPMALSRATERTAERVATGPLLALEGVSLAFGRVKALDDVGFGVERGEICAIIGPNGAGKSTLLNVVTGLYQPDAGTVRFESVAHRAMRASEAAGLGIARTFQNLALFKRMTVADNILAGRALAWRGSFLEHAFRIGRAPAETRAARAKAEAIVDLLELGALRGAAVGTLPYGLQKRVELGRALAAEPRLLLLDEPMAGMNAEEKAMMCRYITAARQRLGATVVLIEHDIGVVMRLAEHVVVLDYGRKIADGTPSEVSANQQVIDAYLGVRH